MSMDALISSLEEEVSSVEDVLAATTKAYSRRAYGEKAWKAAADFLVKQYGPVDAVKIMHHKAMRRAQDAASKNDVRSLVASVKSTVSTWPVKDILAESDETLDEGIRDAIKSVYNKFKEGFKKGLASRGKGKQFKGKPDYWRTVRGQSIGFTGSEGSGNPVIGPQQIISRMKAKTESMQEAKDDEDDLYVLFFANDNGKWISMRPNRDADHFYGAWFSFYKARDMAFEISNVNGRRKPTERQRRNGEMPGYHTEIYKITVDNDEKWPDAKAKWFDRRGDDWDYDTVQDEGKLVYSAAPPDPEDDDYDKGAGGLDDRQMRER
jgi:hypothetical protein